MGIRRREHKPGTGLILGIAIGVALGVSLRNFAVGLAIGVALGLAVESHWRKRRTGDGK